MPKKTSNSRTKKGPRENSKGTTKRSKTKAKIAKNIPMAVREICLAYPDTTEVMGHGMPDFRVTNKTFATFAINHHGDGHLALWLAAPPGATAMLVDAEPNYYYVPPYVGPKGWLGVDLDQGLSWSRIAQHIRDAYAEVAPKKLTAALGPSIEIEPPTDTIDPVLFDPFSPTWAQARVQQIATMALALPETTRDTQFGNPCFRAGKKNFATLYFHDQRLQLSVWAGSEGQATRTFDNRYSIPVFTGHNGWLDLDIQDELLTDEAEALLEDSYRHYALKRMLKALDGLV